MKNYNQITELQGITVIFGKLINWSMWELNNSGNINENLQK